MTYMLYAWTPFRFRWRRFEFSVVSYYNFAQNVINESVRDSDWLLQISSKLVQYWCEVKEKPMARSDTTSDTWATGHTPGRAKTMPSYSIGCRSNNQSIGLLPMNQLPPRSFHIVFGWITVGVLQGQLCVGYWRRSVRRPWVRPWLYLEN